MYVSNKPGLTLKASRIQGAIADSHPLLAEPIKATSSRRAFLNVDPRLLIAIDGGLFMQSLACTIHILHQL